VTQTEKQAIATITIDRISALNGGRAERRNNMKWILYTSPDNKYQSVVNAEKITAQINLYVPAMTAISSGGAGTA
jgi:hypothetical protein